MGNTLTKADIQFDSLSLFRQLDRDTKEYVWYVIAGYTVTTIEGEIINRDKRIELTPAQITVATNFLTGIKNRIKMEEGIS